MCRRNFVEFVSGEVCAGIGNTSVALLTAISATTIFSGKLNQES
jgi:hypothetical protein